MDVSSMARISQGLTQYATQTKSVSNTTNAQAQSAQAQSESEEIGAAFEVDISAEAKQAQQAAKQDNLSVDEDGAQETKGLTADQVRYLEESIAMNEQTMLNMMIQALTESNDKLQGWVDDGIGILNFDGVQIDASRFGLPEVATNAEDAAKAIGEGGDWSVDAVSTRIFDLATAIAGNDPEKLATMRAAVEEGFKQAGATWTNATGLQDMPEISKQTYNEIMSRFDQRTNELNGTSIVQ